MPVQSSFIVALIKVEVAVELKSLEHRKCKTNLDVSVKVSWSLTTKVASRALLRVHVS